MEGISENIPSVQAHIEELLESDQTAKVLDHKITNQWLSKLVTSFTRHFGDEYSLTPQKAVVGQLVELQNELTTTNDNTDAVLSFMRSLALQAVEGEIAFIE